MPVRWAVPEGLRVLADGRWLVGDLPITHAAGLKYLKAHLAFEEGAAFVSVGPARVPVAIEGPPFEVLALRVREDSGQVAVILDDGSEETPGDDAIGMDAATGRFECLVRDGRARAVLSRSAHQTLLEHAEERGGRFYLLAGARAISIRT